MVASTSSTSVVASGSRNEGFLYRVDDSMAASTYSLNKLHPDRGTGFTQSSGSTYSIPLYFMPRPNSVAGKMADECDVAFFAFQHSVRFCCILPDIYSQCGLEKSQLTG